MTGEQPNKVWRYRLSREQIQAQVILGMWLELRKPHDQQDPDGLDREIRREGFAWALPSMAHIDDDELLTPAELSDLLGYSESTIRNWPARYQLPQVNGKYRWGDIEDLINTRNEGNRTNV